MSGHTSVLVKRVVLLGRIQAMRLKFASRRFAIQASLIAVAILLGAGGIGMLMLCLYTMMAEAFGLVVGALSSGALLLGMAMAVLVIATRMKPPSETELLDRLEATVAADLSADLSKFESGLERLEVGTKALLKGDFLSAAVNLVGGLR